MTAPQARVEGIDQTLARAGVRGGGPQRLPRNAELDAEPTIGCRALEVDVPAITLQTQLESVSDEIQQLEELREGFSGLSQFGRGRRHGLPLSGWSGGRFVHVREAGKKRAR